MYLLMVSIIFYVEKYGFILANVKFLRQICFFFCFLEFFSGFSQNAVYSDPQAIAVYRNPAQTGNFLGSIRVSGAYRNQWNSTNTGIYTTSISVDGPLRLSGEHDWIGIGAHVIRDEVSSVNLRNLELGAYAAYHKSLDAFDEHILSGGIGIGYGERSLVSLDNAVFLDELEQVVSVSPDRAQFIFSKRSFLEISIGLQLNSRLSDRLTMNIDMSSRHINRPGISLDIESDYRSEVFYRGQLGFHLNPERKLQFITDYQYLMIGKISQHRGGLIARRMIDLVRENHVEFGGGVHGSGSLYALIGGKIDNNVLRLVYDRTRFYFNTMQEYALELSGYHIFRLRHKPKIKPTLFCPRF